MLFFFTFSRKYKWHVGVLPRKESHFHATLSADSLITTPGNRWPFCSGVLSQGWFTSLIHDFIGCLQLVIPFTHIHLKLTHTWGNIANINWRSGLWCGVIFLQLWSWWPFCCKILRCICSVAFSPKLHPLAYMMCVPPHLVSVEVVYGFPLTKTHRYVFYWQVQLRCTQLPGWNTVFWQQCASHFSHIFSLSHFLREHSESTDGLPIPTKKL